MHARSMQWWILVLVAALSRAAYADDPCSRGAKLADTGELALAHFYLEGCSDAVSYRAYQRVDRTLRNSDHSFVRFIIEPEGAQVTVQGFDHDQPFTAPRALWLLPRTYTITASASGHETVTTTITVGPRTHYPVILKLAPVSAGSVGKQSLDFGDEEAMAAGEVMASRDPSQVKHESLLPTRYRRALAVQAAEARVPAGNVQAVPGIEASRHGGQSAATERRLRFGVRVGLDAARQRAPGRDITMGPLVGAFADLTLADALVLTPEVLYTSRGSAETTLAYVAVPLLAKLRLGKASLAAGPELALTWEDADTVDTGLVAALAWHYRGLLVEGRYRLGLSDAAPNSGKNDVVSLSIGYCF